MSSLFSGTPGPSFRFAAFSAALASLGAWASPTLAISVSTDILRNGAAGPGMGIALFWFRRRLTD